MSDILMPGMRDAKKARKKQEKMMKEQKAKEELKLAEQESEIARRRLLPKTGGRSLLINTSNTGVGNNLGGS